MMNNRATRIWQKIFDGHSNSLRSAVELPTPELKLHLKVLMELIGLRWAMHKVDLERSVPTAKVSFTSSLFDDEAISSPPKPTAKPREGGEDALWWDRKLRYQHFNHLVKAIILRGADVHRLKSRLDLESSETAFLKALAKMTNKKVSWKKMPKVGAEKTFAASLLFIIDPNSDLEQVDKLQGGLSHLLNHVEKALKLI